MTQEWIQHSGDDQPVSDGVIVVVRYRDGSIDGPHFAQSWHWQTPGAPDDVVAYFVAG